MFAPGNIVELTARQVIASFFICVTHFELKLPRSHHFYLREAIGLARDMRLDTDQLNLDLAQTICARRMTALLFITERGCAILVRSVLFLVCVSVLTCLAQQTCVVYPAQAFAHGIFR